MDDKKIRVTNMSGHRCGVALQDGRQFNLLPGVTLPLTEDEIFYLQATTTFFTSGILRIEEARSDLNEKIGIDAGTNPNFATDEDIRARLMGSATKIAAWAQEITEPHVRNRVWEIADTMDLTRTRLSALKSAIPHPGVDD